MEEMEEMAAMAAMVAMEVVFPKVPGLRMATVHNLELEEQILPAFNDWVEGRGPPLALTHNTEAEEVD